MKGNVVELAIGIVIGAAFGRVVGSLVKDWRAIASSLKINENEQEKMAPAFRFADQS